HQRNTRQRQSLRVPPLLYRIRLQPQLKPRLSEELKTWRPTGKTSETPLPEPQQNLLLQKKRFMRSKPASLKPQLKPRALVPRTQKLLPTLSTAFWLNCVRKSSKKSPRSSPTPRKASHSPFSPLLVHKLRPPPTSARCMRFIRSLAAQR